MPDGLSFLRLATNGVVDPHHGAGVIAHELFFALADPHVHFVHFINPISNGNPSALPLVLVDEHPRARGHNVRLCDLRAAADHTSGSSNGCVCIIGIASGMRFVHFNNPLSDGNDSALPLVLVDGHQGARVHNRRVRELWGNCRSRIHVGQ